MKEFMDYIIKNKYVIICVAVVALLYFLGVVKFITELLVFLILIVFAIFIGKTMQDNNGKIKFVIDKIFKKKESTVYYYKDDKKDK